MSDKDVKLKGYVFLRVKVGLLGPPAWCGMCDSLLGKLGHLWQFYLPWLIFSSRPSEERVMRNQVYPSSSSLPASSSYEVWAKCSLIPTSTL